jgi:hypothetical protein
MSESKGKSGIIVSCTMNLCRFHDPEDDQCLKAMVDECLLDKIEEIVTNEKSDLLAACRVGLKYTMIHKQVGEQLNNQSSLLNTSKIPEENLKQIDDAINMLTTAIRQAEGEGE